MIKAPHILRVRKENEHSKVTFIELFFDLVFVFAVTQLSHTLLNHLTGIGLLQVLLLLMAVWWVWIYTAWVTNWLEPEKTLVRLALLVLMLAGLVLSTSLPEAFNGRGPAFALAYTFMQVARSVFTTWAMRGHSKSDYNNYIRITAWLSAAAVLWIVGAFRHGNERLAYWIAALFIEYVAPAAGFWTPRLGRTPSTDWKVEGGHIAERCALFIIIALGESILVTGASFSSTIWSAVTITSFFISFLGSVTMWWIYFDVSAEIASRRITRSSDPGGIARLAYTYVHLPIVAGIIITAVADELMLAHPAGHTDMKTAAAILGGPALYLFGNALFKWITQRRRPYSHFLGTLGLILLMAPAHYVSPLLCGAASTAVLLAIAAWERYSLSCDEKENLANAEEL